MLIFLERFLPPKFDYSRPIPPTLLPRLASNPTNAATSEIELMPLLNGDASPARNGVARNRRGGGNRTRLGSRTDDSGGTYMSEDRPSETPTLDCVICYNEIDVNDRKGYMLAPCDHIFHRQCLEQWMEIKVSFAIGFNPTVATKLFAHWRSSNVFVVLMKQLT